MGTFHFMVHCFTDIVQQAGTFCKTYIQSHFSRQ